MSEVGGTRPKDFHHGGGEECGESGSWISENELTTEGSLSADQPNWQLGRATMPSLWRGKFMLVIQGPQRGRAATSQIGKIENFPPNRVHCIMDEVVISCNM